MTAAPQPARGGSTSTVRMSRSVSSTPWSVGQHQQVPSPIQNRGSVQRGRCAIEQIHK